MINSIFNRNRLFSIKLMDIRNDDMVKKEKNKIDELHKKYSTKKVVLKRRISVYRFSEFYYWHFY